MTMPIHYRGNGEHKYLPVRLEFNEEGDGEDYVLDITFFLYEPPIPPSSAHSDLEASGFYEAEYTLRDKRGNLVESPYFDTLSPRRIDILDLIYQAFEYNALWDRWPFNPHERLS
jgi:hypothetical protein